MHTCTSSSVALTFLLSSSSPRFHLSSIRSLPGFGSFNSAARRSGIVSSEPSRLVSCDLSSRLRDKAKSVPRLHSDCANSVTYGMYCNMMDRIPALPPHSFRNRSCRSLWNTNFFSRIVRTYKKCVTTPDFMPFPFQPDDCNVTGDRPGSAPGIPGQNEAGRMAVGSSWGI